MIPDFDHNNVIPPHLGSPTESKHLSPYNCTSLELCQKLGTSKQRVEILYGLLEFRSKLNTFGITSGYQWLDGSFTENIEKSEKRAPNDLDILTLFYGLTPDQANYIKSSFTEFISSKKSKETYKLDHYPLDIGHNPLVTVELTRYWIQLFTHNRMGVWKGMLKIDLNTPDIDARSLEYLNSLEI